jgi:hypothetical protein
VTDIRRALDFLPIEDVESEVRDHILRYLMGKTDLETMFNRIAPIYEDTSSPTAQQVTSLLLQYTTSKIDLSELRRCLESMNDLMKVFHA